MSVNKVIIIGRLGADPEKVVTGGGHTVAKFNVATSEVWKDAGGQKQERTEWHRIIVWGQQGENCATYLSKGRQVYIEGRLQTRQWDDKEGKKRYTTEIVAQRVQFLGSKNDGGSYSGGATPSGNPDGTPSLDSGPDDIPF